jgi:hypothetical protein
LISITPFEIAKFLKKNVTRTTTQDSKESRYLTTLAKIITHRDGNFEAFSTACNISLAIKLTKYPVSNHNEQHGALAIFDTAKGSASLILLEIASVQPM